MSPGHPVRTVAVSVDEPRQGVITPHAPQSGSKQELNATGVVSCLLALKQPVSLAAGGGPKGLRDSLYAVQTKQRCLRAWTARFSLEGSFGTLQRAGKVSAGPHCRLCSWTDSGLTVAVSPLAAQTPASALQPTDSSHLWQTWPAAGLHTISSSYSATASLSSNTFESVVQRTPASHAILCGASCHLS